MSEAMDIAEQALESKEAGLADIIRLLQQPEDLKRLADIRADYENRSKVAKSSLTSMVQSQVEASRNGMDLLDRAHRHILKLQANLDKIEELAAECADLIDNQERIKLLSLTHSNIKKVLSEIEDIVDLPYRADKCEQMVEDDVANIVPAFEALVVLTGTCENAKQAWQRNNKAKSEVTELANYLNRVAEVMKRFELRLFGYLSNFIDLAIDRPTLLVDCLRIVELQERLDKQFAKVKMREDYQPKRYKARLLLEIERVTEIKFKALVRKGEACGVPNKKIQYDQNGDLIAFLQRDHLGHLIKAVRVAGPKEEVITDAALLKKINIVEEEIFDEAEYLEDLLEGLYSLEEDLSMCYDYVATCFPPSYNIFDNLFQMYHVNFATVIDIIGHKARDISTKGSLRIMEWVQQYMETLRNLGVEEELLRLPVSPQADPDAPPGMVVLMEAYVARMEKTVSDWYKNILQADLKNEPKQASNGTLRTPGAIDFFRIISEEIGVIEAINHHGDVMFQCAKCALRSMTGFQKAQRAILASEALSLEMYVAILNNNVNCYERSLEFAESVQAQVSKEYRAQLDIEEVCRGFLEVAKAAQKRVVECAFNDPGMSSNLKNLYTSSDWLAGKTTSTIVATLRDYFNDFKTWVEASFVKRVAEAALEELFRRSANMLIAGVPHITDAVVKRMRADEGEYEQYFEAFIKADRLSKLMGQLADMRELCSCDTPEAFATAYRNLLQVHAGFTVEVVQKILAARSDLSKKQVADMLGQTRELRKQKENDLKAAGVATQADSSWWGWGKKK